MNAHVLALLSNTVLVCSLYACKQKSLSKEQLQTYIQDPDNGLIHMQSIRDLSVTVQFVPSSLLSDGAMRQDKQENGDPYAKNQYFLLSIQRNGMEALKPGEVDIASHSSLLQTLAFRMTDYASLVVNTDTLHPANSILDRTYGQGPGTQLLLAFPAPATISNEEFYLNDFGLSTGNLHYSFLAQDIQAIPSLQNEL